MNPTEKFLLLMLLANSIESKLLFVENNYNIYPAIFRDDFEEFDENIRRIERLKLGNSNKFLFISQLGKCITKQIIRLNIQ